MAQGRPIGFEYDKVLDQLVELFWTNGYDGTTQADMIQHTGLSSSSLYNTFGDKPSTFDAVLGRYNERITKSCEPLLRGGGIRALETYLDQLEQGARTKDKPSGCLIVSVMSDIQAQSPETSSAHCSKYRQIQREAIARAIDQGVGDRDIAAGDTTVRTEQLLAAIIGFAATSTVSPQPHEALEMMRGIRELVNSWKVDTR